MDDVFTYYLIPINYHNTIVTPDIDGAMGINII